MTEIIFTCGWRACRASFTQTNKTGRTPRFCSKQCRIAHSVMQHRQRRKQRMVSYKGGKCQRCGYQTCIDALIFHHRDPKAKEFTIAGTSHVLWDVVRQELDKCDLLCSNCHYEVHADLVASR